MSAQREREILSLFSQGQSAESIASALGTDSADVQALLVVAMTAAQRKGGGHHPRAIAKALGISTGAVWRYARRFGTAPPASRLDSDQEEWVRESYASGRTVAEAAEEAGVKPSAAAAYLRREGLTRPVSHGEITRGTAMDAFRESGSYRHAAKAAGITPGTARRWIVAEARRARLWGEAAPEGAREYEYRPRVTPDEADLMLQLREQEFSYAEIGKRVGRPGPTVSLTLREVGGLPARVEGIRGRRNPRPEKARGPDKAALRRIMRL